jgi:sulfate transport system ATP-binding protein
MSIEVKHVSRSFGSYRALKDVSLKIEDGELVALLGPSGSGKTTLLRIIAGLEVSDPDPRTEIRLHDADVAGSPVGKRRVGFVFQHYALFRHMSVFENVAFGLRVRPRRERPSNAEIRERVMELLRLIQLDAFGDRYPSQLSGGQRQRVALARALAVQPKVLLLDEPFGALDAQVRKGLRDWLRRLHEEIHLTTVLVTHDQEEALEVADRVVVMNRAKIEQVGAPAEVFHSPASEFVMKFLGQTNVFHGRVRRGEAVAANLSLAYPEYAGEEAKAAIYMRPHELEIERYKNGVPSLEAKITRIHEAGSTAKISTVTLDGHELQVELTLDRLRELSLYMEQTVFVRPKAARIFVQGGEAI